MFCPHFRAEESEGAERVNNVPKTTACWGQGALDAKAQRPGQDPTLLAETAYY